MKEKGRLMKRKWIWLCLLLLLLCPLLSRAEVAYEGLTFTGNEEYIDLQDHVVRDFDAFMAFLDQMPNLKQVDMWQNKMTKEQCDLLAGRYPDMKWGWTMVIRIRKKDEHLVRTDYTSWSTLHNNTSGKHSSEDFSVLKYCWNLMALDIGHNNVTDLSFLYDLPNLRVLIVACNAVEDITPIASLKNLEYLEIFKNKVTDISPLKELPHLMDLNICFNRIKDLTPLQEIKTLKRLWIYSCEKTDTIPPKEAVEALRAALPDTHIDSTHYSTNGGWRTVANNELDPHYEIILKIFGKDHLHPKYEYIPFHDSYPADGVEFPDQIPPLAVKIPQDFSDRAYRLPIDFSTGSAPKASGYSADGGSYSDSTISVTTGTGQYLASLYWYADIQLSDPSQIRTMAATMDGAFDTDGQMDALRIAERSGAVVAINGDCWKTDEKRGMGFVVRQGTLYLDHLDPVSKWKAILMDILLINEDGDFIVLHQPTEGTIRSRVKGKRILNAFTFGPVLVENGQPVKDFGGSDRWFDMRPDEPRQRMCICQVGPLHYKVICCAGNSGIYTGLLLPEFTELVASLGVQTAYNLDGGDSTLLYFNGTRLNEFGSKTQRKLMDIIYFASAE